MNTQSPQYPSRIIQERLPGEDYLKILRYLHFLIRPSRYLEIGVAKGRSIALAYPETYCIGVDPAPHIDCTIQAWTKLYRMTSQHFFTKYIGPPFDLIFIDGLHHYEAVVEDFINSERFCTGGSLIAIHDTVPLTAETSTSAFTPIFWTGDVWKIVPSLIQGRPDLTVFTIACPPTGLTLITGFGQSKGLSNEIINEFKNKEFDWVNKDWKNILQVLPNERPIWGPIVQELASLIRANQ